MLVEGRITSSTFYRPGGKTWAERQARQLHHRFCNRTWWSQVRLALTGRACRLLDLTSVRATCAVLDCHYAGTQTVPLNQIRGSSSPCRCHDFDADFRPLTSHTQNRWLRLAAARLRGTKLPPVALVKLAGVYFVEDGHHRISLARALGEDEIEAKVTVWQPVGGTSTSSEQPRRQVKQAQQLGRRDRYNRDQQPTNEYSSAFHGHMSGHPAPRRVADCQQQPYSPPHLSI